MGAIPSCLRVRGGGRVDGPEGEHDEGQDRSRCGNGSANRCPHYPLRLVRSLATLVAAMQTPSARLVAEPPSARVGAQSPIARPSRQPRMSGGPGTGLTPPPGSGLVANAWVQRRGRVAQHRSAQPVGPRLLGRGVAEAPQLRGVRPLASEPGARAGPGPRPGGPAARTQRPPARRRRCPSVLPPPLRRTCAGASSSGGNGNACLMPITPIPASPSISSGTSLRQRRRRAPLRWTPGRRFRVLRSTSTALASTPTAWPARP